MVGLIHVVSGCDYIKKAKPSTYKLLKTEG